MVPREDGFRSSLFSIIDFLDWTRWAATVPKERLQLERSFRLVSKSDGREKDFILRGVIGGSCRFPTADEEKEVDDRSVTLESREVEEDPDEPFIW